MRFFKKIFVQWTNIRQFQRYRKFIMQIFQVSEDFINFHSKPHLQKPTKIQLMILFLLKHITYYALQFPAFIRLLSLYSVLSLWFLDIEVNVAVNLSFQINNKFSENTLLSLCHVLGHCLEPSVTYTRIQSFSGQHHHTTLINSVLLSTLAIALCISLIEN